MNRKLLILDVALVAAVAWGGLRFRDELRAAKAKEAAMMSRKVKPADPPPFTPVPPGKAVLASEYALIAQKMLLDKSRNPTVVVEIPPPPPPKPMPPLPMYFGSMNLGDGAFAIVSPAQGGSQHELRVGETIGEFKLVDITTQDITLDWEGKQVRKKVDVVVKAEAAPAASNVAPAAPYIPPPPKPAESPKGPGRDSGLGFRDCQPHDSNPVGTVVDGYKKTVTNSVFGALCRWFPAN